LGEGWGEVLYPQDFNSVYPCHYEGAIATEAVCYCVLIRLLATCLPAGG